MKITWAGQSCFKIVISKGRKKVKIAIDPFTKKIGLSPPSFSADILLITHDHNDHNNIKTIKGNPFLIEGPGEYEIQKIFIKGISSFHDKVEGKKKGKNTIYTLRDGGMKVCHLGDLGQKQLTDSQIEKIGGVDILMVPVGGNYTISAKEAQGIISQIEPKIVIPMHYEIPKLKPKLDSLKKFLKAMGQNSVKKKSHFSIKEKNLPTEKMEIIALRP